MRVVDGWVKSGWLSCFGRVKACALSTSRPAIAVAGVLALLFATSSCDSHNRAADTVDRSSVSDHSSASAVASSATQTSSATPTASSEVAAEQARAFVSLAKSGKSTVEWADEVSYFLAGVEVTVLSPSDASKPASWEGCPEGQDTFQEHQCPVSALSVVKNSTKQGGPVISSSVPSTVGCNEVSVSQSWKTTTVAVIRAPEKMSNCVDDFAVVLKLAPDGAVEAVDLELTSP